MRAFISYVNDERESTAFAKWLHEALKRPESPVDPWIDFIDLPPVNTFERRLPTAVNNCQILLFVWMRYTPDSNICMDELRFARNYGKPIITLRVARDTEWDPLIGDFPQVDFTGDREQALQVLFRRIEALNRPEGQIAQLEERLRYKRNELRRLDPVNLNAANREITELEARLKERLAEIQEAAGALRAVPTDAISQHANHAFTVPEAASGVLREIHGDDVPIILIIGPEGIGKTHLVKGLLEQVSAEQRDPQVLMVYRQAHGPQSFTANDLAGLLKDAIRESELETYATRLERLDVAIVRKLEMLIELLRDKRMIVVLDSCEALLDENTGRLVSSELDDALEVLAARHRTFVKLMLVTREQPLVRHRRWLTRAFRLSLEKGLSLAEFKKLLGDMDPDDDSGLLHPQNDVVEALYARTGGRPRAVELVHGILTSASIAESEHSPLTTLAEVVEALAGVGPEDALSFLTGRLIDGLTPEVRRTMQALSAFGVPVDAQAVAFMLPGESLAQIERRLKFLRTHHLVRRSNSDLYYVQPPDDIRALESVRFSVDDGELDRRSLILRAASYFALRRQPEVKGLNDLAAEFAEIDLLLQAEEFEAAFRAVECVDDYLDNWGCRWALHRQREHLRGLLRDDLSELANLQALGDIALQRDDLAVAESFYRQAVSYLEGHYWPDIRKMLFVSLGAVLQRRDEMEKAESYYRNALAIAREYDEEDAEIVPLADLAECYRHWGEFGQAVKFLSRAMKLARTQLQSMPTSDGRRRLADVLLKLGMRYAELGDLGQADALIEEAGEHASAIDSWVTRCQYLDAAANLKLCQNEIPRAMEIAQSALGLAFELGRIPLQRQVYTTLAMCSLLEGNIGEALRDIRSAGRERPPGRALITLALNGLIEYRLDNLWPAQRLFRQLRLEASERSRRDERDFGALDMEGFARCGEHLGHAAPPLNAAINAFRRARDVTQAPGVTAQIVQLLKVMDESRLAPVIVAAAGNEVDLPG